jgi:hypothetical protein
MILKLTRLKPTDDHKNIIEESVLIGSEHIIRVEKAIFKPAYSNGVKSSRIESAGAMITITHVKESIEEINKMLKN